MLWWECNGCFNQVQSDPHSHSDWVVETTLQGPHCEECDQPMDLMSSEGQSEEIEGGKVIIRR